MTGGSDPAFIVQIQLAGKWTTALRLPAERDKLRAQRTLKKLSDSGHYEAVRILQAGGLREDRMSYKLLEESGPLEVSSPVPHKLQPKARFRIERQHGNKAWEHAKNLPTRDDAFALALRYHRQDPHCGVRVLEQVAPDKFDELMHRKASLGSGAEPHRHTANENRSRRSAGMFGWMFACKDCTRRRNMVMMAACLIGLVIISRNEMNVGRENPVEEPQVKLTGLIPATDLGPERLSEVCAQSPELSVNFFMSISVPPADEHLLRDYLDVARTVGSDWSYRQSGDDCYLTLTGGAPARDSAAPTQIDCRIGDFYFTQFEQPSAARAAEGGCRVL